MINRFRIQSFKIIRELELSLDRLTVLVGPNACGKSSVLEAMSFLCRRRNGGFKYDIAELTTRNAAAPLLLRAEGESFKVQWAPEQDSRTVMLQDEQAPVFFDDFEALPKSELFRFEFDNLSAPAVITEAPKLGASGDGLATVLGQLALEYPNVFQRIKGATLAVIPSIRDIRVRVTTVRDQDAPMPAHEILFDTSTKRPQGAAAVNRGLPVQGRAWQEWRDRTRQRTKLHERTRPGNAGRNGGTEKSREPDRLENSRPFWLGPP